MSNGFFNPSSPYYLVHFPIINPPMPIGQQHFCSSSSFSHKLLNNLLGGPEGMMRWGVLHRCVQGLFPPYLFFHLYYPLFKQ